MASPFTTPTVVLLHNGMGGLEIARDLLGDDYPLLLLQPVMAR